jgi:hypothetical protein
MHAKASAVDATIHLAACIGRVTLMSWFDDAIAGMDSSNAVTDSGLFDIRHIAKSPRPG